MEGIKKDIFEFVNLIEIQKLLINYPQLYIYCLKYYVYI